MLKTPDSLLKCGMEVGYGTCPVCKPQNCVSVFCRWCCSLGFTSTSGTEKYTNQTKHYVVLVKYARGSLDVIRVFNACSSNAYITFFGICPDHKKQSAEYSLKKARLEFCKSFFEWPIIAPGKYIIMSTHHFLVLIPLQTIATVPIVFTKHNFLQLLLPDMLGAIILLVLSHLCESVPNTTFCSVY